MHSDAKKENWLLFNAKDAEARDNGHAARSLTTLPIRVRDLKIIVPPDCCAARTTGEHRQALQHIAELADAKAVPASSRRLERQHV